jgi:hypothetical protein
MFSLALFWPVIRPLAAHAVSFGASAFVLQPRCQPGNPDGGELLFLYSAGKQEKRYGVFTPEGF